MQLLVEFLVKMLKDRLRDEEDRQNISLPVSDEKTSLREKMAAGLDLIIIEKGDFLFL